MPDVRRRRGTINTCCVYRLAGGACAWLVVWLVAAPAEGGPPYVIDDPEPTRSGGWETYVFVSGTNTHGATAGQAGIELNYGGASNLQLSLSLPTDFDTSHGLRAGAGDLAAGAKYRFLEAPADSWLPDAAIFPVVTVPTGSWRFGTGHVSVFIPFWLEKDFGKWSSFGGGGYDVNPGVDRRNYTLLGWAVTRRFGDRLTLGAEIYHQTAEVAGGSASTNLGFGATYQVTTHWALMASGGPGLHNPGRAGSSAFYVSLQFTN